MAPSLADKVYLPDLEPCLKGETTILSWKLIASALGNPSGHRQSSEAVVEFLTNSQVQTFFTKPKTIFEAASEQHKQAYETRTSAVQVAPNGKYDIAAIKEDSDWLSRNAGINLVASLRVVLIEQQTRAVSQLTGPMSAQDVASLQEAAGATNAQSTNILPGLKLSGSRDAAEIQAEFEKPTSRRKRIFQTYLSERRHFAMSTEYIFTLMLQGSLPLAPITESTRKIQSSFLDAFGLTSLSTQSGTPLRTYHALLAKYIDLISESIKTCDTITEVVKDNELKESTLQTEWMRTFLVQAIHLMTIAFQLVDLSGQLLPPADLVLQWFRFLRDTSFLDGLGSFPELADLTPSLQCLTCVISLAILDLPRAASILDGEADIDGQIEYIGSSEALELIHQVVITAAEQNVAPAIPVAFAWVPLLHGMWRSYQERTERRDAIQNQKAVETYDSGTQMIPGAGRRNSAGSITTIDKLGYDDFLSNAQMDRDVQPVQTLAALTTSDGLVFNIVASLANCMGTGQEAAFSAPVGSRMRLTLLNLLKVTYVYVSYKAETVEALLTVLSAGDTFWDLSRSDSNDLRRDVISTVLDDQWFLDNYVFQATSRFPYEFSPFVSLCRILSKGKITSGADAHDNIHKLLYSTPTLTLELSEGFNSYELAQEEDNSNTIRLLEDLPLFVVTSSRKLIDTDEEHFIIPAGTFGRFVVDTGRIAIMEYQYSTLAMLGKRLEANLSQTTYQLTLGALTPEETAEAIALIASFIQTEVFRQGSSTAASETGLAVLAEASKALPRTKDIISVVCDTLDVYLEGETDISTLAVLSSAIQFLHAVLAICPGRVWSYMARCAILSNNSRSGRLSKLIGTLELSSDQFDFLISTVRLFSSLVDSAVDSSVQRKMTTKPATRHQANENFWLGVTGKNITHITTAISHSAVDIFESSSTWRFSSNLQQTLLVRNLVPIMNNLMLFTFSTDDVTKKLTLTAPLEKAAKYVIDSFLSPSAGSLRVQPLLSTLVSATQWPETTIYPNALMVSEARTNAVLDLATTLVRVANYFDRSSTTIELQLFKATPFVARVCAASDRYTNGAISLLDALVVSAGKATGEPPSLLGYLGPQTSRAFLQFLSNLDRPFNQPEEVGLIWGFFSTIVRNRQQWMANCLLTGHAPRDARNGQDDSLKTSPTSVLLAAMDRLTSIATIPETEALAILDFVTSAQNFWPWTIFNLQNNDEFVVSLRKYVRELRRSSVVSKSNVIQACNEARIAAYIAETFAMQLFHLRQLGRADTLAQELSQDCDYFLREGVAVAGYNDTLHTNFARNFTAQYPGCTLDNFKRTLFAPRSLGSDYYYDLSLADRILSFDAGWKGPRNNGFKSEMQKANANLSLVDAQIALFHGWEFLLLELSTCLPKSATLTKQVLQVAEQCLEANQENQGHEQIFERMADARVDLALMLVQRVVNNKMALTDVAHLLSTVWSTVSSVEEPYSADNLPLYRTLLKLLYVSLRAEVRALTQTTRTDPEKRAVNRSTTQISQAVLSILEIAVAKGFRTLVSLIHDSDSSVGPDDIAILTAILQTSLCIPGIQQSQTQVVNIMASQDAFHVAVSLYSWSDKLADKGDPVYGEVSLLFLLELSALPLVAEQLACDGLLNHLTSSSMAAYLGKPNISPFADSVGPQRCYSIWAKAIVPLLLNILTALGQTIAPEVAYVLNNFSNLMKSSVERFEAPGGSRTQIRSRGNYVTLTSVSEIHSLALMTRVLGIYRENNSRDIPEVEWDSVSLLENVEYWLQYPRILRERLMPLGPREAEWKAMKPSDAGKAKGYESRLEEKVVEQLEGVQTVLTESME